MKTIRTIEEMTATVKLLKSQDKSLGLVPTMGFLREGHLSLVKESLKKADVILGEQVENRIKDRIKQGQPESNQDHLIPEVDLDFLFHFAGGHLNPLIRFQVSGVRCQEPGPGLRAVAKTMTPQA